MTRGLRYEFFAALILCVSIRHFRRSERIGLDASGVAVHLNPRDDFPDPLLRLAVFPDIQMDFDMPIVPVVLKLFREQTTGVNGE